MDKVIFTFAGNDVLTTNIEGDWNLLRLHNAAEALSEAWKNLAGNVSLKKEEAQVKETSDDTPA